MTPDPSSFDARRTSFGRQAHAYDAARPGWPASTMAWLTGDVDGRLDVLDLGCGTGKGSRTLVDAGHRVVAVDPSLGMLQLLSDWRDTRSEEDRHRLVIREGVAEQLPVADGSVDAVVCLQAWHWFDPGPASAEVARVLRPGGTLGLAWHVWRGHPEWREELRDVLSGGDDELAQRVLPGDDVDVAVDGFGEFTVERFPYALRQTVDDLVLNIGSWSAVAVSDRRAEILAGVRALAERIVEPDGMVTFDYLTLCARSVVDEAVEETA